MIPGQIMLVLATVLLAAGLWLLLPRGARGRRAGAVLAAAGLALLAWQVARFDGRHWGAEAVFWTLAATTVVSALGAVTMRSPVYCAIWFALTLLGTAGLFLFQGAQFLGVATVVVYAGAILVTFLFVLMLAQPRGQTRYDRLSWEALLSASTGAMLVGMLTAVLIGQTGGKEPGSTAALATAISQHDREQRILHPQHVAQLGGQLFSRHLVAIEVAGTLLLVALVGAVAIVSHGRPAAVGEGSDRG
ncbi:MAG: NADH-quinone oxidoreductase subunit J [Pirellulales bacterium]